MSVVQDLNRKISSFDALPRNKVLSSAISGAVVVRESSMTSKHLLELKERLLGFEGPTADVALAVAARSALRAVPLLERLSWEEQSRQSGGFIDAGEVEAAG